MLSSGTIEHLGGALIQRMQGEPIEGNEWFWVTLRDPEDEQFVWDRFQA